MPSIQIKAKFIGTTGAGFVTNIKYDVYFIEKYAQPYSAGYLQVAISNDESKRRDIVCNYSTCSKFRENWEIVEIDTTKLSEFSDTVRRNIKYQVRRTNLDKLEI